jgi:hypothetical protein
VATTVADGQPQDMKAGRRRVTVAALARARRLVTVAAADAQPRVTAVADVLLPAPAVAIRRRAAQRHMVVVDPRTAAAVAADMGGNTALDFSA